MPLMEPDNESQLSTLVSSAPPSTSEPVTSAEFQPQRSPGGLFLSWRVIAEPTKTQHDGEDQRDPGLLFINHNSSAVLQPPERKRMRSHVMQRHAHKRKEKAMKDNRRRAQGGRQLIPHADRVLGASDIDPFETLPVIMSSSNSRLLHYFAEHIAPLHYPPHGGELAKRNPMTTTWIATAVTDKALLHSTLSSSSGHMLYYANLPTTSSELLSAFLSHKAETIRIINERVMDTPKALTDETLGAIALLITGQTCQGDYNEMSIHLRGLAQLVSMRGGLGTLGMSGLLAGELLWCDNVTAFVTSAPPLLKLPEISNNPLESFEDPLLNLYFTSDRISKNRSSSFVWSPTIRQTLSDDLIAALRSLNTMTMFLDTSPLLSEHDMLVYDLKRATIQHQLANVTIPPAALDSYHITESCRLAAVIYSILALWGFKPPMSLYGDLAKMLQKALQTTDNVCHWGIWSDMLLWTLFMGGFASFGRVERLWFSNMITETLRSRKFMDWFTVREALETMPVCQPLWDQFEELWREAAIVMHEGNVVSDGDQIPTVE